MPPRASVLPSFCSLRPSLMSFDNFSCVLWTLSHRAWKLWSTIFWTGLGPRSVNVHICSQWFDVTLIVHSSAPRETQHQELSWESPSRCEDSHSRAHDGVLFFPVQGPRGSREGLARATQQTAHGIDDIDETVLVLSKYLALTRKYYELWGPRPYTDSTTQSLLANTCLEIAERAMREFVTVMQNACSLKCLTAIPRQEKDLEITSIRFTAAFVLSCPSSHAICNWNQLLT